MRREKHNFFLCWLFHLIPPPRAAPPPQTTGLASAGSENRLASSKPKSQLTAFFSNPKILSASGYDVIHVPSPISSLGFLLWHLWLSHPPRTRVNTCTQCVHLLTHALSREVLSLTKPKCKIYETKNDNIKKIPPQLYYIFTFGQIPLRKV